MNTAARPQALASGGAEIVDLRFTDMLGRWLHVAHWAVGRDAVSVEGVAVAAGNLAGWGRMEDSELRLLPDPASAFVDPFAARPTAAIVCEAVDPLRLTPSPRDSRATLRRALDALVRAGIADALDVGPELEFHLLDDARFLVSPTESFVRLAESDGLHNSSAAMEGGNPGHRVAYPAWHLALPPADGASDMRADLLAWAAASGLEPLHHVHEAGPSQHEIGMRHRPALAAADAVQRLKWLIHVAARRWGKTATFMPKPMPWQPGSGLHLNLSLRREQRNLFAGDAPGALSPLAQRFLGGLVAHARALNAVLNPSTNSYKRLATLYPGAAAPSWGVANRSAPFRVPRTSAAESRIELRFADAAANPYLAVAAVLCAGLDGVERGLDPGPPATDNLRRAGEGGVRARRPESLARDLGEAVLALDADRAFLERDGVFAPELIDALLAELERQLHVNRGLPHPNEFYMYFSV